jgi:N-acetylneuraminic acid mutarotase
VIGGESGGIATDVVQQIDPATGAVTIVGHLPAPRTQSSALVLGGQLFVFGGASSGTTGAHIFADVLRWEPVAGGFTTAGSLPYPIADAAATTVDGHTGYLVGGESPARVNTTIVVTTR